MRATSRASLLSVAALPSRVYFSCTKCPQGSQSGGPKLTASAQLVPAAGHQVSAWSGSKAQSARAQATSHRWTLAAAKKPLHLQGQAAKLCAMRVFSQERRQQKTNKASSPHLC